MEFLLTMLMIWLPLGLLWGAIGILRDDVKGGLAIAAIVYIVVFIAYAIWFLVGWLPNSGYELSF